MEHRKRPRSAGAETWASPARERRSALAGVVGSLVIAVPLTATGLLAVWAGFFLRNQPFFSVAAPKDEVEYTFVISWLPQAAACVSCSVLWLTGGVCILLGLGLLGDFWHVDGHQLLGVWALAHAGAFGVAAAIVGMLHPQPAVFWNETRSVLLSPLSNLTLPWRIYFAVFSTALLGSSLIVLAKKRVGK